MKIRIQSKDVKFNLHIPNWLVFSKAGERFLIYGSKKAYEERPLPLSKVQMKELMKISKKIAHQFKGLDLVHVESAEGETIYIEL